MRLFSTEQVSKYHPDKYADQISDAVLDACLNEDINSRVACECMVKGETVILAGEITTKANPNYAAIVNRVAHKLGYKASNIITYIDRQSPEIAKGIENGGAGDQGMMYGYACSDTESLLPYGFDLANRIIAAIERDVETPGSILLGDAKCQVTTDIDAQPGPDMVERVLVSVCHRPDQSVETVRRLIQSILFDLGVDNHTTEIIVRRTRRRLRTDRQEDRMRPVRRILPRGRRSLLRQRPLEGRPQRRIHGSENRLRPAEKTQPRLVRGSDRIRHRTDAAGERYRRQPTDRKERRLRRRGNERL